jgi:ParB-like chromosome segregation protein Spo0J
MNRKFSLEKVKANQAKVAKSLLDRDDDMRRAPALPGLLESRQRSEVALVSILDRLAPDARPLTPAHVVTLADSITRLGLISPIAVDRSHRLIAGGHRRAALRLLALAPEARDQAFKLLVEAFYRDALQPAWDAVPLRRLRDRLGALPVWSGLVPVFIMDVDVGQDPEQALRIEIAENEHRKQYTREQVLDLAQRLRDSGVKDTPGRPKAGERSLRPELIEAFGISRATVTRYLSDGGPAPRSQPGERFARLRRELRMALPLMPDDVASNARLLAAQLDAVVEALAARRRLNQGPSSTGADTRPTRPEVAHTAAPEGPGPIAT